MLFASAAWPQDADKIVFRKDLGEGLFAVAVIRHEEIKPTPLTPLQEKLAADVARASGESLERCREGFEGYSGPAETFSVIVGKDPPASGQRVWWFIKDHPDMFRPVRVGQLGGKAVARSPSPFEGFRLYDIAKSKNTVYVLRHEDTDIHLDEVKIDGQGKPTDRGYTFLFFNKLPPSNTEGWLNDSPSFQKAGYLPLARAMIIPAQEKAYVFTISESGKSLLWEAKAQDEKEDSFQSAKLVWTSDGMLKIPQPKLEDDGHNGKKAIEGRE